MAISATRRPDGTAEWVVRDECPWQFHVFSNKPKSGYVDGNRRNPCLFDRSGNVSDRHMTHRSDGHQQENIDRCGPEGVEPVWQGTLAEPSL